MAARDGVDKITALRPEDVRVYVSPSPPGMLHSVDAGPREGEIRVNYFVHVASEADAAELAAHDSMVTLSVFFVARGDGVTVAETLEHIRGSPFRVPFVTSSSGAPALAIASAYVDRPSFFSLLVLLVFFSLLVFLFFFARPALPLSPSVRPLRPPPRVRALASHRATARSLTPLPSPMRTATHRSFLFRRRFVLFPRIDLLHSRYGASFMGRAIPAQAASPPPSAAATRASHSPAALPSGIDSMLSSALAELATARSSPLPVAAFVASPTLGVNPRRSPGGAPTSSSSARRGTFFGTYNVDATVRVLLCTVTLYANLAHNLTRSP